MSAGTCFCLSGSKGEGGGEHRAGGCLWGNFPFFHGSFTFAYGTGPLFLI